ncbi:MAG: DUF1343 domain-containing protein [Bacteroidaceae bacterium]|nr:DUF1343 domain-containing protein [Bacteroidaceae bacterium]
MKKTGIAGRIFFTAALSLLWCCTAIAQQLLLGDERPEVYAPLLEGKRIAIYSNQTGCNSQGEHVLDVFLKRGLNVTTLFGPEHGFRGTADAGAHVSSSVDERTGIPILSLYDAGRDGPSDEAMQRFDVLVVDIQDVGLRFYTYYVTMLRLMKRCGQCDRDVVILDRPNPNGHYIDGPILDMSLKSGVGALPIPIVHGLTLGELALMAQGEGWVEHACRLTVVPCAGYTHRTFYMLPIAPSPNLPDMRSIYLYPSTCFFEGTCVSLGRGTPYPFQMYGHPAMRGKFRFTPVSRPGATHPVLENQLCRGVNLRGMSMKRLQRLQRVELGYVVDAYRRMGRPADFFPRNGRFFDLLAGQRYVREMILSGASADDIRARWQEDVQSFRAQRRPYLLYPE